MVLAGFELNVPSPTRWFLLARTESKLPSPTQNLPDTALLLRRTPGNFYGLGQTRKRELVKACGVLGVEEVSAGRSCCGQQAPPYVVPFEL